MSREYKIIVSISAEYSHENIKTVLERGLNCNLSYHKFMDYSDRSLSSEEAADYLLEQINEDNMHCLTIRICNVFANLYFFGGENRTNVMLSSISYEFLKKFKNSNQNINIAEYAKVLLDITQDFEIESMSIEQD